MLNNFLSGFILALSGFGLIFKKGIRSFVIVPFLINLTVFSGALWLGWNGLGRWLDAMVVWLPSWLQWVQWLIWPLAIFAGVTMVYYTFTLLANLIAAPFNSLLSERVEIRLNGEAVPPFQGYKTIPSLLARTVWSEFRKIIYQIKWLVLLVILTIIPGINLIAPFAWLYFGAWMLAIEYGEYPMANHGLLFTEVKTKIKAERAVAMGMGAGIMLFTLIPVLNFFVMPVGVASGTALWVKRLNRGTL